MALENFTQPEYHPQPTNPSGGLQGLYSMVHSFLRLVQTNSFPEDLVTRLFKRETDITKPEAYKELLLYEAGFLVCIIIGLLFIILTPLVGLCFCCCRCCGNCGGRMYQKQTKNTGCKRQALFVSVLAVTIIILAGDICAYVSNHRTSQTVGESFSAFNSTMDNLNTFLNSIPKEIDFIINASSVPLDQANRSLLDIGHTLGDKIKHQLEGQAFRALNTAEHLLQEIGIVELELQAINSSVSQLKELQEELAQNLTTLSNEINKTLNDCGKPCQNFSLDNLVSGTNFSMVPDLSRPLQLIANLTRLNPSATLEKARQVLNDIPKNVSEQSQKVVSEAQSDLNHVKQKIQDIRSNFSVLDSLVNVSDSLSDITKKANTYEPFVITYDGYRWIVGICLCSLVLLITVFSMLGLLFGALGLDPRVLPSKRGCLSNCGGLLFMAGVGLSFIFAWLLMLLVLLTFLVGGNIYTLVCQSWTNGHLLQFLDTPGLFPELNLTRLLQLNSSDVTLSSLYKNCTNNAPLWKTLHLDEIIPLDETLNISKYTQGIDSALNKLNVSLDTTDLLDDEQRRLILGLGKKNGSLHLNFTSALEQLNQNMMEQNLSALAKKLDSLAEHTKPEIGKDLQQHASELRNIQTRTNSTFSPKIQVLNKNILSLQKSVSLIPELVNSTVSQVEEAQKFMKQRTKEVVMNESVAFVHSMLGFFESYMDWAKNNIRGEVARCGPAAWTLDSMHTIVCSYVTDSLNAFWFSLGWCTIFLLPSIILAVRLAKFYRRMHMDDVYEDNVETMELSRPPPNMYKMPRAELRK